MPIPIELLELRARLEDVGIVVVQEPDYLTIRLPFFCSVRVKLVDGRLNLEAFFGLFGRVRSTTTKFIALVAVSGLATRYGLQYAVPVTVLSVMVGCYETIRWIITEQAKTRVQTIRALAPRSVPSATQLSQLTGDTTARFAPVTPNEAQRSGRHATPVAPEASSPRSR